MALGGLLGMLGLGSAAKSAEPSDRTAYEFEFKAIDGSPLPLSEFKGKEVLIVNTASFCGFTGQYDGLEKLYEKYKDRGLVVLGVPSNDFGEQEPGSETEIKKFCETKFNVNFPLTQKYDVVGDEAHPFYKWALQELGSGAKPRWNFHKYLVAPDGRLVDWFSSITGPSSSRVERAIEKNLPRPGPS
jgi:glutathione peroxidase